MLRSVRLVRDIPSASNPSVRCGCPSGPEAEQRLKRGHRLPTPIVPKDELIQVDLKLCLTDPVVRANQPLLEVANSAVRERHDGGCAFAQGAWARLGTPNVFRRSTRPGIGTRYIATVGVSPSRTLARGHIADS